MTDISKMAPTTHFNAEFREQNIFPSPEALMERHEARNKEENRPVDTSLPELASANNVDTEHPWNKVIRLAIEAKDLASNAPAVSRVEVARILPMLQAVVRFMAGADNPEQHAGKVRKRKERRHGKKRTDASTKMDLDRESTSNSKRKRDGEERGVEQPEDQRLEKNQPTQYGANKKTSAECGTDIGLVTSSNSDKEKYLYSYRCHRCPHWLVPVDFESRAIRYVGTQWPLEMRLSGSDI